MFGRKEFYHGWLIELIPTLDGYSFQCWLPEEMVAVSDRQTYSTLEQALTVAKMRADSEAVCWVLAERLYEYYEQKMLSLEEYASMLESVVRFVSSDSQPHL